MPWKFSKLIMSDDMLLVHLSTCGRIYTRKASDSRRPRIMIFAVEWLFKKRDMAAPERVLLFPISNGAKPNLRLPPYFLQTFRMKILVFVLVISFVFLELVRTEHTGVSGDAFGTVARTRLTAASNWA